MKVIIAGSRTISRYSIIEKAIAESKFDITEVVSGTARGVDTAGEHWGLIKNIPIQRFIANWDSIGKSAGYVRNVQMAKYADGLIAIWDGKSRGTEHMISVMKRMEKPVFVYKYEREIHGKEVNSNRT